MTDRTLVWLGLAGIGVAVLLSLILVERLGTTYQDGLDVAADAAVLAAGAADPVRELTEDLTALTDTIAQGLAEAGSVIDSAEASLSQLGASAATDLAATVEGLASLADRVAGVVETVERFIPGDIVTAAEDLRQIADSLAPVSDSLRSLGAQLEATAVQLADFETTIAELETQVADLAVDLEELAPSADQLADAAASLAERVEAAQERVDSSMWLARLIVVLLGVVLALILMLASRPRLPEPVSEGSGSA